MNYLNMRKSNPWGFFKVKQTLLPVYGFSTNKKRWVSAKYKTKVLFLERLRILTLNVWFIDQFFHTRFKMQVEIFEEKDPDVIALQEVNKKYIDLLGSNSFIRKNYFLSDNPGQSSTFGYYGVMLLIKRNVLPAVKLMRKMTLPSEMQRDLIHVDMSLSKEENAKEHSEKNSFVMNVATIHLESMQAPFLRQYQLDKISRDLQIKYNDALLMGDFNFDEDRNYHQNVKPLENEFLTKTGGDWKSYKDIWRQLKGSEKGYTFDTETNIMVKSLQKRGNYVERMRYDRIMLKSVNYEAKEVEIVGNEPLKGKKKIFPSDHYGVFTILELKK